MIIDLFQDKRIYHNSSQRKKAHSNHNSQIHHQNKNALPEIKYTPSILKKMQEDVILARDQHNRISQIYNEPLSNILISKKIPHHAYSGNNVQHIHNGNMVLATGNSPMLAKKRPHINIQQIPVNNFVSFGNRKDRI